MRIKSIGLSFVPDLLLTVREVAALKRANLSTVRSLVGRGNIPSMVVGKRRYVWMSSIMDYPIPHTLSDAQASFLCIKPDISLAKHSAASASKFGRWQDPRIHVSKGHTRRNLLKLRNDTGQTPPTPAEYCCMSLEELDIAALELRRFTNNNGPIFR